MHWIQLMSNFVQQCQIVSDIHGEIYVLNFYTFIEKTIAFVNIFAISGPLFDKTKILNYIKILQDNKESCNQYFGGKLGI